MQQHPKDIRMLVKDYFIVEHLSTCSKCSSSGHDIEISFEREITLFMSHLRETITGVLWGLSLGIPWACTCG